MRAKLSVVIPTLNAAGHLPDTLACLMEGLSGGLIRELIVSDGGSTDATQRIAEDVGAIWVSGPASRGGQLGRGVAASEGVYLLLLHADTHLSEGWSDTVSRAIEAGQAGYGHLAFRSRRPGARMVAGWANLRSRFFGLPYGDQALLISRAALEAAGGVPDQPLMEDVELARRLRGQLTPLDMVAATSFERYERGGVLRRGARNLGLLTRYLCGADPADLAARYHR